MTYKNRYILIGFSLLTVGIIAASCSPSSPDQHQSRQEPNYYQQEAPQALSSPQSYPSQGGPVIVQSPQSSGFMDGFMGGMLGGMLGNNNSSRHTIERDRIVERPIYQFPRSAVRLPTLPPTPAPQPPAKPVESKGLQNFRGGNWGAPSSAPSKRASSSLSTFKSGNWGSSRRK